MSFMQCVLAVIMMLYRPRDATRVQEWLVISGVITAKGFRGVRWFGVWLVCFVSFFGKYIASQTLFLQFLGICFAIRLPMQRLCRAKGE